MEVKAKLSNLRVSPRKVRLVGNLIKGLSFYEAEAQLKFSARKSAEALLKLLNSAAASAVHNFGLDKKNLYIKEIFVNVGPSLKRWMPRARGIATPILKRTSNIILILAEIKPAKGKIKGKKSEIATIKAEELEAEALKEKAKKEKAKILSEKKEERLKPKEKGGMRGFMRKIFQRKTQ